MDLGIDDGVSGNENSSSPPSPPPPPGHPPEQQQGENPDVFMELILEFQSVTGSEDMEESRRILERHDWDLLQAISSQMGFEHLPPQQYNFPNEAQPHSSNTPRPPPPTQVQDDAFVSRRPRMEVATPARNGGIFSWIWRLVTTPVDFFFRYLWNFIGFGLRFIRQDPRQAITNPVEDVVLFISQYESKYGTAHPVFYQGTYNQALNDAKRELKFLLVYLHSDDHDDTDVFCRAVMPNQDFQDIIRENMLFWACSVSLPEGYRTSQALRENTYPFLALIALKNNRMTCVTRIEGEVNRENVVARLQQGVADNEAFLVAERQERLERSMTQTLRQQQDAAYMESLKADQQKEKRKREEQEKKLQDELEKKRIENEEKERRETLRRQKIEAGLSLKEEPVPTEPDTVKMVIKLPNGNRLERRFRKSDSLKHLYLFVFSHQEAPDFFEIATNFPKRTLPCKPTDENPEPVSFIDFGLGRNEMLFVYDLES